MKAIDFKKLLLDMLSLIRQPVGTCYITSTNTNPSEWLGGEWTLIHKKFKPQWITAGFTYNTTNTQSGSFVAILSENTIEFRFAWQNKIAISDDTKQIGTFDKSKIGITGTEHTCYGVGHADGLHSVGMFVIDMGDTPHLSSWDWVSRATTLPTTTGQNCYFNYTYVVRKDYMIDSFCDTFIWKRVS